MQNYLRRIAVVGTAVLAAAICVAVALAKANAPQQIAQETSRVSPAKAGLRITATERWRVTLPVDHVGLPAADDAGIVATAGGSQVIAVGNDGSVRWTTALAGALARAPRLDKDLVFVAAERAVVALQRASGAIAWAMPTAAEGQPPDRANQPVVVGEVVVVTTSAGLVYGLDRATGTTQWTVELPTASTAEPAAVDDNVVVVGIGEWYGIDATTGALRWSRELGLFGTSSPVAFMDVGVPTAVVASDEQLIAVDATTGNLLWQSAAEQSELYQVPHLDRSHNLLVPDHWGRVTAYDAHTGEREWSTAGTDTIAEFGEPLSLAPDVVVFSLDDGGPRIASPEGAASLDLPNDGHGVARFGDDGIVVSTWGGSTNYLLAYRIDVGS